MRQRDFFRRLCRGLFGRGCLRLRGRGHLARGLGFGCDLRGRCRDRLFLGDFLDVVGLVALHGQDLVDLLRRGRHFGIRLLRRRRRCLQVNIVVAGVFGVFHGIRALRRDGRCLFAGGCGLVTLLDLRDLLDGNEIHGQCLDIGDLELGRRAD